MPREFKLPDVGEGVAEGEIVQWLVSVGDEVTEDQPIAEVETDKALVELPSPVDGVVAELHAEEGEMVPVGTVIVTFEVEGEAAAESGAAEGEADVAADETAEAESAEIPGVEEEAEPVESGPSADEADASAGGTRTFAPPNVRRLARELGVDLGSVAGSGPGGRVTEGDVKTAAEGETGEADEPAGATEAAGGAAASDADAADSEAAAGGTDAAAGAATAPATGAGQAADREKTLAAPATRRVARELGVDIDAVPAVEERDGEAFVTAEAVRQFAEAAEAGAAGAAGEAPAAGRAQVDAGPTGGAAQVAAGGERETTEPYRGLRRTIGDRMVQSKSTIPHVHSFETIEVSRLVETRERLKPAAEEQGISLTFMPLIMKALVAALKEFPSLNATLDEDAEEIVYKHYYNVGIATHTEAGLMVPVVKNVEEKGLLQVASEISELSQKARDRSIALEEMQGGTFTITNYGAVGGEFGAPIINHPEVAILGVGRIEERPVVDEGEVVARPTLPISLGIDHRVIDGGTSAAFKNRLKAYLQEPTKLLLE